MGLLQNMQGGQGAPQANQQAGDDPMQKALMDMLGATLMGDGGEAVASRIGAGEDKIQGVAEAVGSGIYTILKQARDAGRSVPAKNIVKALYEGCREMLSTGKIDDADSKIDALARALQHLVQMDQQADVIDDQILAEAGQLLQQIVAKMEEAEAGGQPQAPQQPAPQQQGAA